MVAVHGSSLVDRDPLIQIILRELKNAGLPSPKLETPKPPKRSLVPFSTPGGSSAPPPTGRLFGKRLTDLSKLLVSLDGHTDVVVPKFVVSACTYIEKHLGAEGIYRLSGSSARQKKIRSVLESSEQDLLELNPAPSVLDVSSLLKQFLRELPLPILPTNLHILLTEANKKNVSSLQLVLLLLPPEHLSCLSYLCRHLAAVAARSAANKMNAKNLAIVLTPSLFPLQESLMNASGKDRLLMESDLKLKSNTSIVENLIENASQIGYLSSPLYDRYTATINQPGYSTSEDNLDDDCGPSKRKSKKRVRRRSGSLSRVLGIMGKGIRAMARANTPSKSSESVHSTPLPQFGATPDFPSPRAVQPKRKAAADHELSPSNKSQKRGFESTFTPKMRTRTFSVKRFKRKKSEVKMPRETLIVHAHLTGTPPTNDLCSPLRYKKKGSPPPSVTSVDAPSSNMYKAESMEWEVEDHQNSQFDEDYADVKAQYEELKEQTRRLEQDEYGGNRVRGDDKENGGSLESVQERYAAALANGSMAQETRETARQIARVKRRSSESVKKPRSPSQRRIGVIRRRSREREERSRASPNSLGGPSPRERGGLGPSPRERGGQGPSPRERGRSPGPRRNINRSPVTKAPMTPHIDEPGFKNRLQRGRPNTGLEKPSPVPYIGPQGKMKIKNSFKSKEKPAALRALVPILSDEKSPLRQSPRTSAKKISQSSSTSVPSLTKKLSQSDSIVSLRNDLHNMIEKSFSASDTRSCSEASSQDSVFEPAVDSVDAGKENHNAEDVFELSSKMANVSFKREFEDPEQALNITTEEFLKKPSPITRSQLRRQSASFEFTRPTVSVVRKHDGFRRQSSAFEFRSQTALVEPIYENLSRDVASRASLRRRNSSVKDLIQKMESEARRRVVVAPVGLNEVRENADEPEFEDTDMFKTLETNFDEPTTTEPIHVFGPASTERTPSPTAATQETWIDGSEFFKNVLQVENGPVCGRSSIVKIRQENRGRVLDSVNKFSTTTPSGRRGCPVTGTRRMSARMGICGASPSLPPPPVTRRQTLTGIKTSAGPRTSAHYTAQTVATMNKRRDKSPNMPPTIQAKKSPNVRTHLHFDNRRRKSPNLQPNQRTLERRPSSNTSAKAGVRRTVSNPKKTKKDRANRRNDRRFLTIGYEDELRSPLRECSNIQANIKRSNSDQTPSSKKDQARSGRTPQASENSYQNIQVFRTQSLKSDVMMSPALKMTPRNDRVRRAMSERTTPRPFIKVTSSSVHKGLFRGDIVGEGTPRRSPRLQNLI